MMIALAAVAAAFLWASVSGFVPVHHSYVRSRSSLSMSAALIVQNKGGGHGELGYQLAKNLSSNPKITSITILQDDACDDSKEPFKSYGSDLPGVRVVKAPLGDEGMTAEAMKYLLGEGATYDYVWDNASKKPVGAGKAVCDCAKDWGVKLLTYVSSAGMYQPTAGTAFPMAETTAIKESAGQALYDKYAVDLGLPLVSFRPQYIYGPKSNKNDYIDWFFDRLVRGLPLPIPGDGNQKVSLTNSEDVASLLASVLNDEEAAVEQRFFNCGTDQLLSYNEVAQLCAEAAGVEADIYHYDGDLFGKAKFPFRLTDFYVAPHVAKSKLKWEGPKHTLKGDLPWYYAGYVARGGATKKMDLGKDWEIVVGSKSSFELGSVYNKYDPLVVVEAPDVQPLGVVALEADVAGLPNRPLDMGETLPSKMSAIARDKARSAQPSGEPPTLQPDAAGLPNRPLDTGESPPSKMSGFASDKPGVQPSGDTPKLEVDSRGPS